MSLRLRAVSAIALALFLTVGCGGEPPEKEMQQAQGALDAAQAAGADKYASEEFTAAQQALTAARQAVDQRDYRLALDRAIDSRERAQNAAKMAADGKAAARVDADRALTAADAAIVAASAKLTAAEAAKVPARTVAAARKNVDTATSGVQEARALFDKGDYLSVPEKTKAATASLSAALAPIDAAMAAPGKRRR
jgi:hypothetical protein